MIYGPPQPSNYIFIVQDALLILAKCMHIRYSIYGILDKWESGEHLLEGCQMWEISIDKDGCGDQSKVRSCLEPQSKGSTFLTPQSNNMKQISMNSTQLTTSHPVFLTLICICVYWYLPFHQSSCIPRNVPSQNSPAY